MLEARVTGSVGVGGARDGTECGVGNVGVGVGVGTGVGTRCPLTDALSLRADHGTGSNDNSNVTLLTPNFFAVWALEGLRVIGEERDILQDVRRGTRDGEKEEAISKIVKELST